MKWLFSTAVVIWLFLIGAISAPAQKASGKVEKELLKLQDQWAEARVKRDVPFLEKFYGKEFHINNIWGGDDSREDDIRNFASGDLKPEVVKDEEMKVSAYGDVGVVTGIEKLKGTYKNNPGEFTLRFTNIYVRRDGRWQIVLHHATMVPQEN